MIAIIALKISELKSSSGIFLTSIERCFSYKPAIKKDKIVIANIKLHDWRFNNKVSAVGISKDLKYRDRKRAKKRHIKSPIRRISGSLLFVESIGNIYYNI
ncbi:MAG: hypothetical protein WCO18_00955 [bacterium]